MVGRTLSPTYFLFTDLSVKRNNWKKQTFYQLLFRYGFPRRGYGESEKVGGLSC